MKKIKDYFATEKGKKTLFIIKLIYEIITPLILFGITAYMMFSQTATPKTSIFVVLSLLTLMVFFVPTSKKRFFLASSYLIILCIYFYGLLVYHNDISSVSIKALYVLYYSSIVLNVTYLYFFVTHKK